MDDSSHSPVEPQSPGLHLQTQHAAAFFPNSHNFVVSGGDFTAITNIYNPSPSARIDFRTIPLGDLDLRQEIHGSMVNRRSRRGYARRIYHARIDGRNSKMTIALYQGKAAEKVWWHELKNYSRLRHPNLVQLYAAASSNDLYATVFHDELVPLNDTLRLYRHSPISTVYLMGIFAMDVTDAEDYVESVTGEYLDLDCTLWIRASTGRLCVELTPSGENYTALLCNVYTDRLPMSLLGERTIISALTLAQYQNICSSYLALGKSVPIYPGATVNLGAIVSTSGNVHLENLVQVAHATDQDLDDSGWKVNAISDTETPEPIIMGNGWTRFPSEQMANKSVHRTIDCRRALNNSWLSQANHIFSRLRVTSNYEDYVLMAYVSYSVILLGSQESTPGGYLFVCPLQDLRSETQNAMEFRSPDQLAYWSLDSSGADRLSPEEAERLGFPKLLLCANVWESCWDESVYDGLRQFHEGKGFDPDSQDIARHLEVPLYQLFAERDALFAHVEEVNPGDPAPIAPQHASRVSGDTSEFSITSPITDWILEPTLIRSRFPRVRACVVHMTLYGLLRSLGIILAFVAAWFSILR
ncbi:hypothetical protein DFH09DRAFT_1190084 [Mycena vulgaris]|nr:hypothetical protein DFH09DRAFT_1190084 [Mycena vulgaris]